MRPGPFIQVDEALWRGPQPTLDDLRDLRDKGLTAVVSLREEGQYGQPPYGQSEALAVGLRWHLVPVRDHGIPTLEQVREFLALVDNHRGGTVLVHCLGGVGRTGVFVSCYRIARHGWTALEAIKQSHLEVPWLPLNEVQREFIRKFEQAVTRA